jgi:hypothetical protein
MEGGNDMASKIRAIMCNPDLTDVEKSKQRQALMMGKWATKIVPQTEDSVSKAGNITRAGDPGTRRHQPPCWPHRQQPGRRHNEPGRHPEVRLLPQPLRPPCDGEAGGPCSCSPARLCTQGRATSAVAICGAPAASAQCAGSAAPCACACGHQWRISTT